MQSAIFYIYTVLTCLRYYCL